MRFTSWGGACVWSFGRGGVVDLTLVAYFGLWRSRWEVLRCQRREEGGQVGLCFEWESQPRGSGSIIKVFETLC